MRSDTLYGHLLCAAATLVGAEKVEALIAAFKGGSPPFQVSSAFPQGLLPMPLLPQLTRSECRAIVPERKEFDGQLYGAFEATKRFRKCAFVLRRL